MSLVVWSEHGPARPILLVHGLASNALLWSGVAGRLAELGHPVAAVDQRGHGLSEKPADGYDFPRLCQDLLDVVEDLGWSSKRPYLVGQSWGGNVVLDLAARHPGASSGICLVDGGTIELSGRFADWDTCASALAPPRLDGLRATDLEAMMRARHPDWSTEALEATMANLEELPDGTVRARLPRTIHMAILRHLWEHRPSELYHRVSVPVLLIMAQDTDSRRAMAQKRHEVSVALSSLASARVRWVPGDHDLHAQHPELVAELVSAEASRP